MKQKKQDLKVSDHIYKVVENHFDDIDMQNLAIESWRKAKPKSYPEVYRKIFISSKYSRLIFHVLSLLIALSFGFNLISWVINAMGVPSVHWFFPLVVAGFLLGIFERFQDVCLDALFELKFQTGKYEMPLLLAAALFSLISIVTSVYSAKELTAFSQYAYFAVGLSLMVEFMIIATSYMIHQYHHKAALTVNLLNDLYNPTTNSTLPYFDNLKIEVDTAVKKVNGHKLPNDKKIAYNQAQSLVSTTATAKTDDVKTWNKSMVKAEAKRYALRLKEKETLPRKEQSFFFDYVYKNWSDLQSGGVVPVVPTTVRKEFYQTKNPKIIQDYIS